MNEYNEFEKGIVDDLKNLSSDEMDLSKINPWRRPMRHISWGMALTMITLNILSLNLFLPAIGYVLLYLGIRSFRNENKWFRISWIISALIAVKYLIQTLISDKSGKVLTPTVIIIGALMQVALFLCLRKAFLTVDKHAVGKAYKDPFIWASSLITLMALFVLFKIDAVILPFIILVAFIIIFRAVYKMNVYLNKKGYAVRSSQVKVNPTPIMITYIALLLCCFVFVNHIRADYSNFIREENTASESLLIDKGFQPELVECMSESEIQLLAGTTHILQNNDKLYFNRARSYIENGYFTDSIKEPNRTKYVKGRFYVDNTTTYAVTDSSTMYIINYFEYNNLNSFWNDSFCVWSSGKNPKIIGGKLLYDNDGKTYSADIPQLDYSDYQDIFFSDVSNSRRIEGKVSFPAKSENRRGYIIYKVDVSENINGCVSFDYYHRLFPDSLPSEVQYEALSTFNPSIEFQQNYSTFTKEGLKMEQLF